MCVCGGGKCITLQFEPVVDYPDEELIHVVGILMTEAGFTLKQVLKMCVYGQTYAHT